MILTCKCGKTWEYQGQKRVRKKFPLYVTCPDCLNKVKVQKIEEEK